MLYPFLQLLLQVLVQTEWHDLLQEEIRTSIYSMAAVNFVTYHQQLLPKFLTSVEGLTPEQQQQLVSNYKMVEVRSEVDWYYNFMCNYILHNMHSSYTSTQDLPSFVQDVRQFANDLRYFLILNQSVPAGSVKLS